MYTKNVSHDIEINFANKPINRVQASVLEYYYIAND